MSFIEKRKKKFGDRVEGHRIKKAPAVNRVMVSIYPNRCDNEVSSKMDLDITNVMNYVKMRREKDPNCKITFFHCFIAAVVRVLNEKRLLLRFVQNHRLYERDEIRISFTAKRAFKERAEESIVTYVAKKDDNIDSVTDCVIGRLNVIRDDKAIKSMEEGKGTLESLQRFPDFMLRWLGFFLRRFDKHGWITKDMMREDPSFTTAMLANLGSIGLNSVYHHLNNYGSCSIMITIGKIVEKEVTNEQGNKEKRSYVDVTAIFDERIADGFYFFNAMKLMQEYLKHPEVLEKKFDEEVKF